MQTYWELPGRQQQQHETKQQVLFGVQRKRSPQSAVGSPAVWVFGELDEMAKMGEDVGKDGIEFNMDLLLNKACYLDALEIPMWNKRYFELTTGDIAVRLVLIFHYKGIEEAEIFFSNIPENLRALEVYIALLYCYAKLDSVYKSESVKKAEAIMQTLRDLGLDRETMAYNCMLNLYYQTGKLEKIESMVLEIEEKGIGYNDYTFYIRLSAYAAVSDCKGIKKMVTMMESHPNFVVDLSVYAIAASRYARDGLLDKTYAMLKKCEGLATGGQDRYPPYDFLISKKGLLGKAEVIINAQSRGLNPDVRTWYLMATGWIPSKECLAVFLKWFEAGKDTEEAEHLANLEGDFFVSSDLLYDLLNYLQHGYVEKYPWSSWFRLSRYSNLLNRIWNWESSPQV
ncbi:pentatricopeptide repeat-containing protein [Citrus sinensis]|nr:pentatricopeptide repeat-containing protein [Citrus sinensis]